MEKLKIMRPKKIVAEVEMPDGTFKTLETDNITREQLTAMLEAEGKKISGDLMYTQLAVVFGGKKEDYYWITDVRVAKQIIGFVLEQVKNPE